MAVVLEVVLQQSNPLNYIAMEKLHCFLCGYFLSCENLSSSGSPEMGLPTLLRLQQGW